MLVIFGADFTGRSVINIVTFGYLFNFILLVIVISVVIKNIRLGKLDINKNFTPEQLWKSFFVFVIVFMVIVYSFSSQAYTLLTYRYLVLLPFLSLFLIIDWINALTKTKQLLLSFLIVLSILFNIGTTLKAAKSSQPVVDNRANSQNFDLINSLQSRGLRKGYSQYWDANITSYFTNNKLSVLPVLCSPENITKPFLWMINAGLYSYPANKTYVILNSNTSQSPPMCNLTSINNQFGKPKSFYVIDDYTVLVYNYDIQNKM